MAFGKGVDRTARSNGEEQRCLLLLVETVGLECVVSPDASCDGLGEAVEPRASFDVGLFVTWKPLHDVGRSPADVVPGRPAAVYPVPVANDAVAIVKSVQLQVGLEVLGLGVVQK